MSRREHTCDPRVEAAEKLIYGVPSAEQVRLQRVALPLLGAIGSLLLVIARSHPDCPACTKELDAFRWLEGELTDEEWAARYPDPGAS